jgi:cell division protein FtsI/penicillin-binding protein 2
MLISRLLTILFLLGIGGSIGLLLWLAWRDRRLRRETDETPNPGHEANRWLRLVGALFLIGALAVLGMHSYWALWADGNQPFVEARQARDARNRRIEESGLRGWIFDRHQRVDTMLAGYRAVGDEMVRTYPLKDAAVHVLGYFSILRGSASAELAYADRLRSDLQTWNLFSGEDVVGEDLTLTLDARLQQVAAEALMATKKHGAAVVLSVETGDVLAMVSSPSFDPPAVDVDAVWTALRQDPTQPFVNRALNQYYLPGSTFKVIVAASALEHGMEDATFLCSRQGYRPGGTTRPIYDDKGPDEVHGKVGLAEALRVSCNQYFAQLGVELGHERLAKTARRFGFRVHETPDEARERLFEAGVWANPDEDFRRVFRPNASRLVLSRRTSAPDLAFESYGQSFIQVTPLHMALVAATIANPEGKMMCARLDTLYEPREFKRVLAPPEAQKLRAMMRQVTGHPGGTAYAAFSSMRVLNVDTGGKTGTAQFAVNEKEHRVDSWFIGFAPVNAPQIAYAVVVAGGGYGAEAAAPIAATIVREAVRLDLVKMK